MGMDMQEGSKVLSDVAPCGPGRTGDGFRIKARSFDWGRKGRRDGAPSHRILSLTVAAGIAALAALLLMSGERAYLLVSLLTGMVAIAIDFVIEYAGISKKAWDYPTARLSFRNVPLEVPLLFFCCGILATFVTYLLSRTPMGALISGQVIAGLNLIQINLLIMGAYYAIQYFRGAVKSLVFWALPLSIALFISFPEPWILAFAISPIYLDYYLEKRLVRSSDIRYEGYGEDVAVNVSISYFPTTLFILGIVTMLLHFLGG